MPSMSGSTLERKFWFKALCVFGFLVLLNYLPIFWGKIPFPSDEVLRHSAWNAEVRETLPELIDVVALFYPFRAAIGRAAGEHTLPLWNPYIMSGTPLAPNAQSAVFAPQHFLYYVLPLKTAWTVILFLRLFLAAAFMALFVRAIGCSATGSIVAGILWAFCGYTIAWQGFSNGESNIWLPLMCYAVHRLHLKPDGFSIALAGSAFAMPTLSGHPETAAHTALVAGVMAAFFWVFPDRPGVPRFETRYALRFVLAGFLAVGVASVQLIPTLEWLGQLGLQVEQPQPGPDRHQGQTFFSRDITRHPSSAGLWVPEASAYIGMIGLLAASLSLFHPSRRYVYLFLGIAVLSAAAAFSVPPVHWIVVHLPIVKAMKNGRLMLVTDFAIAALAAFGISAIGEHIRNRAMALLTIVFVIVAAGIYELHRATLTPVGLLRSPAASIAFLVAALILLVLRLRGSLTDSLFSLLIVGFAGLEMITFSYGYLTFAYPSDVFPPAPVFDFIHAQDNGTTLFRVAKDRVPIPHDAGAIYGFEAADGYDISTERTRLFHSGLVEEREDGVMFLAEKILAARDRRLDMLNVKYMLVTKPGPQFDLLSASGRFVPVFAQEHVAVFENKTALPRFWTVPLSGVEVIPGASAQLARLKESSFDPERSVLLAERPSGTGSQNMSENVAVLERGMNGYRLRVDSGAPAVLVVSQIYYPGWKARVDGSDVPVYPANAGLTALVIPSGSHEVRLFFRPTSFEVGLVITVVAVLVAAVLAFGEIKRFL
jgi:hypothetical protein